jgi:hypothetical protein
MKPPEQSNLLKEILAGEELADFRQASLEQGLNALRQRQRRRRGVRIGTVLLLPLFFVLMFLSRRTPETSRQQIASIKPITTALPTPPAGGQDTKLITDEELFALFPNRPLALVGKPGQQQLVFLDRSSKSRQP